MEKIIQDIESGAIRAAEKVNGKWIANPDVKEAIIKIFAQGNLTQSNGIQSFDKDNIYLKDIRLSDNIRMPYGSSARFCTYISPGTIILPPSFINLGAYIDTGVLVDSHVLIGSCAQIGKNIHISAGVKIGGVIEPRGSVPVIIEDNAFIGANATMLEGAIISEGAVVCPGTMLSGGMKLYDLVNNTIIEPPLIVPKNAVVAAGNKASQSELGQELGISTYCPVIIKYRDEKTDAKLILEEVLR